MIRYMPITWARHQNLRWQKYENYSFARSIVVAPLVMVELSRAARNFPIAFIESKMGIEPFAILSLDSKQNAFVAPDGRWLASYVPAYFRSYPFRLLPNEKGDFVLCVDLESDRITEAEAGEPFFNPDQSVGSETKRVLEFLSRFEQDREKTRIACAALKDESIITDWKITIESAGDQKRILDGLSKINEGALNGLLASQLLNLRNKGSLALAYCQMISMHNVESVQRLSEFHLKEERERQGLVEMTLYNESNGEIDIDWDAFSQK